MYCLTYMLISSLNLIRSKLANASFKCIDGLSVPGKLCHICPGFTTLITKLQVMSCYARKKKEKLHETFVSLKINSRDHYYPCNFLQPIKFDNLGLRQKDILPQVRETELLVDCFNGIRYMVNGPNSFNDHLDTLIFDISPMSIVMVSMNIVEHEFFRKFPYL